MTEKITHSDAEWRAKLSPEAYQVMRQKGTERPFSGEHYQTTAAGEYLCQGCGAHLFESVTKFDAHCGWPSFYAPATPAAVEEHVDSAHGMVRTEITCARCDAHLGHVFPDGPQPTGLRYCLNSVALRFEPSR